MAAMFIDGGRAGRDRQAKKEKAVTDRLRQTKRPMQRAQRQPQELTYDFYTRTQGHILRSRFKTTICLQKKNWFTGAL